MPLFGTFVDHRGLSMRPQMGQAQGFSNRLTEAQPGTKSRKVSHSRVTGTSASQLRRRIATDCMLLSMQKRVACFLRTMREPHGPDSRAINVCGIVAGTLKK